MIEDLDYIRLMSKINDISKNLKREDVYRASKELESLKKLVNAIKRKK